jgi:type II secretory ATPase GspE/PulE/Tfp pilus assembly ATPase PilB-like protein
LASKPILESMPPTIDSTLKRISRQTEEQAAADQAKRLGVQYAQLDDFPFNLEVLKLIPVEQVEAMQVAVYLHSPARAKVAVVHPEREDVQKFLIGLQQQLGTAVEMDIVSATSMRHLLTSYLKLAQEAKEQAEQRDLQLSQRAQHDYFRTVQTLEDLQIKVSQVSVTELLDVVLAAAVNQAASDIHLEPGEQVLTVRFRIDGVLRKVLELPMSQHHAVVSRLKLMSSVKLDQQGTSQDGRFSLLNQGINADVRISTIPTGYGEGIVMRILRQDLQALDLNELGFTPYSQEVIDRVIRKPYGLILVTGPTGSGKSTTMYSLLKLLNSPEKKIITLEDPIEYRIPGLQQSQVDAEKGFTFAEGLRGALRQDPDIVMVGEIRDPETATIALNASLTGHLVLSTLHTNDAVTSSTRFIEMGIPPFLLSGSIQMIIAQRLVRKLVPGSDPQNPQYQGRLVISELLVPNQEFEQAVIQHKDRQTLQEIAIRSGMVPMLQDGLAKVKAGLTTESEIYRVTSV